MTSQPILPAPAPVSGSVQPARVSLRVTPDGKLFSKISGHAGTMDRMVAADDPVRIASISKLVTALGVMVLVDDATLDLDRDVGDYLGQPFRNPNFPDRPISLRMLLSHTSGLRDGGEYFLPLDGKWTDLVAGRAAWDSAHPPGEYFSYANLNSPIVAVIMERATGERFDHLMQRLVMKPLGLNACFNWSGCDVISRQQAVTLLRPDGELAKDAPWTQSEEECVFVAATNGGCDIRLYVTGENGSSFGPQGGLRISARDLLKVANVLTNRGAPLFSEKSFSEMTKPYWRFDGQNGDVEGGAFHAYGLGIDIQPGGWIGHVGDAFGLRAGLWVNQGSGEKRVQFVTMVDEKLPVGRCLDNCP
ncbi:serine hydrolase domain-containing protein [Sphingorhabdus arenilitoris]|uniref:Serine hydrolase domain-containing protein n=1 Tax=Sphingorhabdus arenilitoris TaxID=1490041 RepID=A0ABV8RJT6_9SPHN